MKKFLSMILALVMLLSAVALTSCAKPEKKIEKAELVFEEDSYKMTVKTTFSSSNSELDALLNAKETEIPIVYDNDILVFGNKSSAMQMTVENNVLGTVSPAVFTVVDSALFLDEGMLKNDSKVQVLLAMSDKKKFFDAFNARLVVDDTHFEDCDSKKNVLTFSDLTEEGEIELKYALRRILLGIYEEYSVELTDCSYSITMNGKKYEKAELSYTHNVTVNGNTFPVTVDMVVDYTYDNIANIVEPSGSYERKTFEEFF